MSRKCVTRRHYGFTLIEVITTIVVVAIAAAALLGVFTGAIRGSADPMIQQQAVSIAEAYMEEILLKAFIDPDGIGGETRPTYDDVQDYNGLTDVGARDQTDNAIAGLGAYTITVTVGGDSLNAIPVIDSLRIDISVNHPAIDPIVLSGYRTRYP